MSGLCYEATHSERLVSLRGDSWQDMKVWCQFVLLGGNLHLFIEYLLQDFRVIVSIASPCLVWPLMIYQTVCHEKPNTDCMLMAFSIFCTSSRLVVTERHIQLAFSKLSHWAASHEFRSSPTTTFTVHFSHIWSFLLRTICMTGDFRWLRIHSSWYDFYHHFIQQLHL